MMNNMEKDVYCPRCGEKKKDYKPKIFFDPLLSDKKKGKLVYRCTNHPEWIYFCIEEWEVNDAISSMRIYVIHDKRPDEKFRK